MERLFCTVIEASRPRHRVVCDSFQLGAKAPKNGSVLSGCKKKCIAVFHILICGTTIVYVLSDVESIFEILGKKWPQQVPTKETQIQATTKFINLFPYSSCIDQTWNWNWSALFHSDTKLITTVVHEKDLNNWGPWGTNAGGWSMGHKTPWSHPSRKKNNCCVTRKLATHIFVLVYLFRWEDEIWFKIPPLSGPQPTEHRCQIRWWTGVNFPPSPMTADKQILEGNHRILVELWTKQFCWRSFFSSCKIYPPECSHFRPTKAASWNWNFIHANCHETEVLRAHLFCYSLNNCQSAHWQQLSSAKIFDLVCSCNTHKINNFAMQTNTFTIANSQSMHTSQSVFWF